MDRADVFSRHVLAACPLAATASFDRPTSAGPNPVASRGGEAGPGSANGNAVIVAPGWATQNNRSFAVVNYAAPNGGAAPVSPGPKDRRPNYFSGGPDDEAASATQRVDPSFAASGHRRRWRGLHVVALAGRLLEPERPHLAECELARFDANSPRQRRHQRSSGADNA